MGTQLAKNLLPDLCVHGYVAHSERIQHQPSDFPCLVMTADAICIEKRTQLRDVSALGEKRHSRQDNGKKQERVNSHRHILFNVPLQTSYSRHECAKLLSVGLLTPTLLM